ncbi:MAG: TIGR03013 family XrtA/PEP-CTERM system glycosyltransferase [Candidatus Acidiferrales bacterium]
MARIGGQKVPAKTIWMIVSDVALIVSGLVGATVLRFLSDYGTVRQNVFSTQTIWRFAIVVSVCEFSLYFNDLYSPEVFNQRNLVALRLLQSFTLSTVALAFIYYLGPSLSLGRGIAALAAPLILGLTLGWRVLVDRTHLFLWGPERMLVMGTDNTGVQLVREIITRPELRYKVVGFLDERGENIGKSLVNPGIIGAAADVGAIVEDQKVDRVVLALSERRGCMPVGQLLQLKFAGVGVEEAHSCYERVTGRILIERLSPSWLILSDGFRKSRWLLVVKRVMDFSVAAVLLLVGLPIMLIVALAVWFETGFPTLFRQTRAGLNGTEFQVMKFRSMRHNAEADGPRWAVERDPRITRVGRFIRKFRLDELPQLVNVLRGEMSLVGPRPERPHFCKMLENEMPFYALRHSVRPGVTGWAQIKYPYGSTVEDARAKLEHDLFYIKNMSLALDLAIIFETAKVMLYQRGAR